MHDRIFFLDSLRAAAIFMVVGIHSLGYCTPLPPNQKAILSFIVHTVAVPIFFSVDGFLFARKVFLRKENNYKDYVRKSLVRLILPWFVFSVFYTVMRYCFELSGFLNDHLILGHSFQEVLVSTYGSVIAGQMYFLFSLFLIRLCTPFFRKIVLLQVHFTAIFGLALCVISRACSSIVSPYLQIEGGQEPLLHAIWGLQFYFSGIILYRTFQIIRPHRLLLPFFILFISAIIFQEVLGNILGNLKNAIIQYLYLGTLFFLFTIFQNPVSLVSWIGKNTMGVYLLHAPIVLKAVSIVVNKLPFAPIFNYIALLTITSMISIALVFIINKFSFGPILFGLAHQQNAPFTKN
jgi:surface polysaccharide O-acyltransferase-like enzyme